MTTLRKKITAIIKNTCIHKIEQARAKHSEDKEFQKFLDHMEKLLTTPSHRDQVPEYLAEDRRQEIKEAQKAAKKKTERN